MQSALVVMDINNLTESKSFINWGVKNTELFRTFLGGGQWDKRKCQKIHNQFRPEKAIWSKTSILSCAYQWSRANWLGPWKTAVIDNIS